MTLSPPPYSNEYVASLFPKGTSSNINKYWPLICRWLDEYDASTDEKLVIYTLATIRAETYPLFSPAAERPSKYTLLKHDGQVREFGQYELPGKKLGNHRAPDQMEQMLRARHGVAPLVDDNDGFNFRGRGFVQLTGRWNYTDMQRRLEPYIPGLNILEEPDKVSDPEIAAHIIAVWVAKLKREKILHAMQSKDYKLARKAVNVGALNMEAFMEVIHAHKRNALLFDHFLAKKNQRIA